MGIPGLREAKTRYHPHHMVEVYSIQSRPYDMDRCPCTYLFGAPGPAAKVRW
jgi:uncharacterized protein